MTRTEKLYRKLPSHFKQMTLEEASREKIKCAKEYIDDLQKVDLYQRDEFLITELQKAIAHHEFLLVENDEMEVEEKRKKTYNIYELGRGQRFVLDFSPSEKTKGVFQGMDGMFAKVIYDGYNQIEYLHCSVVVRLDEEV